MEKKGKGVPVQIRFDPEQEKMLAEIQERTGISKSEIVRLCIHYALQQVEKANSMDPLIPGWGDLTGVFEKPKDEE